jgi:hypothetical protein
MATRPTVALLTLQANQQDRSPSARSNLLAALIRLVFSFYELECAFTTTIPLSITGL